MITIGEEEEEDEANNNNDNGTLIEGILILNINPLSFLSPPLYDYRKYAKLVSQYEID